MTTGSKTHKKFEEITGPYWKAAYGLIFRIVHDKATAEDVLQESLIRAMKKIDQLRNPKAAKSWFLSIAHSTAINWMRKYKKTVPVDFIEEIATLDKADNRQANVSTVEEAAQAKDEAKWMEGILSSLPPIYREILHLRYKEHLSYKELADTINLPMSSVKFRIHQGIKLLKEKMKI